MNPWAILGLVAFVLLTNAGSFKFGINFEEGRQAREDQHIAQAVDAANNASAEAISKLKPVYTTIKQTLEKEIHEKPVYTDCRNTAAGMQSINSALAGNVPTDKSKLSEANPAK